VAIREKRTAYAVTLEQDGRLAAEGNEGIRFDPEWTPEHLFLAALARCCVGALAIHARRLSLDVTATAETSGTVGRRDDDSWGFLDLECRATVDIRPEPDDETIEMLLRKAERGCFIGGSVRPEPTYAWTVNGRGR
jgi:organic hydroperoxide reductase OsmC/OhrA